MAKSKRIKPGSPKKGKSNINPTIADKDETICFSFKYLREGKDKFLYKNLPSGYFLLLIDRLEQLSKKTIKEYHCDSAFKDQFRCHKIKWGSKTTENSFGVPNEEQIVDEPWQLFKLTDNEGGRVHGFIIGNCFYIVWLDKGHELYPDD